jgi:hypothetical protein
MMQVLKYLVPICSASSKMFGHPNVLLAMLQRSQSGLELYDMHQTPNYSYSSTSGLWKTNKYSESNNVFETQAGLASANPAIKDFDSAAGTTYLFSKQLYYNTTPGVKNITSEQPTICLFDGDYANKVMFI